MIGIHILKETTLRGGLIMKNKSLYPLQLKHLYYEKIWGGRALNHFRKDLPEGEIGESWDVACHKNGTSVISNGIYQNTPLPTLIDDLGVDLIGTSIDASLFPLLVKLISANEPLSVQVHPSNEYALEHEGDLGKTEVWYIMDATDDAYLYVGVKDNVDRDTFVNAMNDGTILQHLHKVTVKAGDVYFIKSGTVHAIGEGVIIAEIQQNSDTTYRLYDYGRDRPIHKEQALCVTNFDYHPTNRTGLKSVHKGYSKTYLCLCNEFSLEHYQITDQVTESSDEERFYIFTCVDGSGTLESASDTITLEKGDSILIPATLGAYTINGSISLLKSYVPDVEKVKVEMMHNVL